MTLKEYLIELGHSAEDAATLAADEKMAKALTASMTRYEEGTRAQTEAEAIRSKVEKDKQDLTAWWRDTAQPAILAADSGNAAAKAEAARYQEYIRTLKSQGYQVPDEWVSTSNPPANPTVTNPNSNAPAFDARQAAIDMARNTAMAVDLDNEYRELFGSPIPGGLSGLLDESLSAGKSLRDHVRTKFNFDGKRAEIAEKKTQERIDSIVREKTAALEAKYAQTHNPNLAPAVTSKAAAVVEAQGDNADSWKTRKGRQEAKKDRILQFRNLKVS